MNYLFRWGYSSSQIVAYLASEYRENSRVANSGNLNQLFFKQFHVLVDDDYWYIEEIIPSQSMEITWNCHLIVLSLWGNLTVVENHYATAYGETHPLVPSIGSKTQCLPTGPPSDFPQSIALVTSSVDKVELYEPSLTTVSLTSFVMRSNISCPLSSCKSLESWKRVNSEAGKVHSKIRTEHTFGSLNYRKIHFLTSSATKEKGSDESSFCNTKLTTACEPGIYKIGDLMYFQNSMKEQSYRHKVEHSKHIKNSTLLKFHRKWVQRLLDE